MTDTTNASSTVTVTEPVTTTSTLPPPPPPPPPAEATPPDLGDAGKQAIDRMKAERNAARAEAAAAKAEVDALKAAQMTEQERAIATARAEAAAEAKAEVLGDVNERLFSAALQVAAATDIPIADGKTVRIADPSLLADPEVARRLLGLSEIPVTDTGDIDTEAISAAVAALAAAKPYLTASATPTPGSADQGARTPPPPPKDIDSQIVEAEANGDWVAAGQLKLHKLAASPRP